MLSLFDGIRDIRFISVLVRMLFACFCGTLIGLERSMKNRPAGFRTHILVCLGACIAALTGLYMLLGMSLPVDISRIGGQVVTGLGFIGAGTIIITKKLTIKGLTTAAGLWTTGVIGLAIGSGYVELGLVGTVLVLLAETLVFQWSGMIRTSPEYVVEIAYNNKEALDEVLRLCKDRRMSITNLRIHTLESSGADYAAEVSLRGNVKSEELISAVRLMKGIVSVVVL